MKVLVVGSGAKESAIVDKLERSPSLDKLFRWPAQGKGIKPEQSIGLIDGVAITDVARRARVLGVNLVVLASDEAVTSGLGNVLETFRIPCFGPTRVAAHFQWDPASTERLLQACPLPMAKQSCAHTAADGAALALRELERNGSVVVRAAVPDQHKMRRICVGPSDVEHCFADIERALARNGCQATYSIVERIDGPVSTFTAFVGNRAVVPIGSVSYSEVDDRARASAYAPVSWHAEDAESRLLDEAVVPIAAALRRGGAPYSGMLTIEVTWRANTPVITDLACVPDDLTMSVLALADGRDWLKIMRYTSGIHALAAAEALAPDKHPAVALISNDGDTFAQSGPSVAEAWDACSRLVQERVLIRARKCERLG